MSGPDLPKVPQSLRKWRRAVPDGGGNLLDRVMQGLAQPRSRRVLYCLAEDEPQEIGELAAAVAYLETGSKATEEQRECVQTAIYHKVLPKLAGLILVEYDAWSRTVCFCDPPDELLEPLRLCRELEVGNWRRRSRAFGQISLQTGFSHRSR